VENTVEIERDWCLKSMNPWDQIREYLQQRVSAQSFDNWLRGTAFAGIDGETLYVSTPDRETRTWLETEYAEMVTAGIRELGLPVRQVSYEAQAARGERNEALASMNGDEVEATASLLNPKFTFDSFVVGSCNQFAHAADDLWLPIHPAATIPSSCTEGLAWGRLISCTPLGVS
jgi:chromosomal replication initiator protein